MKGVISLATSKGGAGKTTLARSLACHWHGLGIKVGVIDADPQASFVSRHDPDGLLKGMPVDANPEETVNISIDNMIQTCPLIIVDTGGFRNKTTIRALIKTDLALIPLKPSSDDVAAAVETYNLIQELNETPERIKNPIRYKMVLTMTQQGTVISRHVRDELKTIGYQLLDNELFHRVAYPEAAIKGIAPSLIDPESPAARDVARIASEIHEELKRGAFPEESPL